MFCKRVIQALAFAAVNFAVLPTSRAEPPPVGVYSCFDTQLHFSPVTHRSDLVITPQPFAMFGIIDATTYSDWDGHHGRYNYDDAGGLLTMTDGSRQGWRYRRTASWSFTLIDNRTGATIYTCPLDKKKNPERGPW